LQLRVYVAPCGIGLGHITRCEPIADALVSQGAEVVYSTYSDGLDYARRRGLPTLPTVSIGFKVKEDGTVDFKMTATTSGFSLGVKRFLEQLTAEIRNIKRFEPDVVLSDSRVSSLIAGKLMGVPVALILNQFRVEIVKRPSARKITPVERLFFLIANIFWLFFRTLLGGIWAGSNVILIPDFPAPYTISASNLAIPKRYKKKVKLIGPIVSDEPKRRSSRGALNGSLFFASRKPLIYAAVSGPKTERTVLAGLLLESLAGFPNEYEVVISRGEPNGSSAPVRDRNLTVYGWIEDQYEVLEASSVVVSRAGHGTIMKSIMLGKPMILIPIPDHTEQYGNAKRASKLGLAEIVPQREVTTERLLDATKKLLHSPPAGMERLNRNTPFTEAIPIAAHEIDALASTRQT
jgi:UDP-N-acetylglucosamine--N-acetylmuramyl-(pentapeptide) pyrophosphoryl-undecaprenol N-acetylglucosamine transferase